MTPGTLSRVAIVLLLTISPSPGLRGDEPRLPVPVPLVVTDSRGRSISDLAPADLEITENGSPRSITSVQFHGPAPRRIVILLDEYHVSPGAHSERTRASVETFITRHVRATDTVTVVRPPARYDASLRDPAAASTALEQFAGRKGDYTPRGSFEATYMGSAPAYAARQRAQIVRAALESVANSMRDDEGAKALIVVTEGFEQGEPTGSRITTLRAIGRAARISNVPVYILDPSESRPEASPLNEAWRTIAIQTGGMLFEAGRPMEASFGRIAADLAARYVIRFDASSRQDGRFHDIDVQVKRKDAIVRAPTGYWSPFAASRFAAPPVKRAELRSAHTSGLIQPLLRMAPGPPGRSRVTFAWAPGRQDARPARVVVEAVTFDGRKLHAAVVPPLDSSTADASREVTFDASPGSIQLSLAIQDGSGALLDTDVQHVNVPRFDGSKPVIAAVEFVRPGSPAEFLAMQTDRLALPTDAREFFRHDRLLLRVRAFAGSRPAVVTVRLLDYARKQVVQLPALPSIGEASQFDLPFAGYARGDYFLDVHAVSGGVEAHHRVPFRLVGR